MAGYKRYIADIIERMLDVTIVPRGAVGPVFERDHLARFFVDFRVDCIFDVGANEGQYAQMLRGLGYVGPIVSFEPIPDVAASLRTKARRDPLWYIEEVALDEIERTASFNVMQGSQFSSLKSPSRAETDKFIGLNAVAYTVDVTTAPLSSSYDEYKGKLAFNRPFLKMDTQGNDLAVARGAGSRLQRFVGLQSEMAVKRIYAATVDYRTALDFFLAEGFEISAFVPNNLGHFPSLIEFDCIMYNKDFLV